MAIDETLPQTGEELRRGIQRSLERTRPPTQVPGYQVERFLGSGAYGEVWVARDRNTGRRVAIKFYTHRGGLDWSLLSREVEKLAFLFADRYVVQLIDVGWDADPPYYIMEYLDNGSLAERLKQGPMPVEEAVTLFRDVAIGLVHAHGKGVLHCDLKPANVLLDQDLHPRLADFGQSRMSNEQRPALGTMFYMAPEQAALNAVPDARWDVYALGAVLYCMLTGEPPYRTAEAATVVSQGTDLQDQLRRYVRVLEQSPHPTAHRNVPGVGRDLADIVNRCVTINPAKRFANPQAVLDALQARSLRRARRPLLVLGALGPALLLGVMGAFAWNGAETSVKDSERALTGRSLESNRFAARFVAETVAGQIDRRWYTLEKEAADPYFLRHYEAAVGKPWPDDARKQLQAEVERMAKDYAGLSAASWFVLDATGHQLARSPLREDSIDKQFAYRDYFNGLGRDLPPTETDVAPLDSPHRSHVYLSEVTDKFTLAFSVPIWQGQDGDERVIGVLGITANMGHFAVLRPQDAAEQDRVVVLIDTRPDGAPEHRRGLVLEHPYLNGLMRKDAGFRKVYLTPPQVARLEKLRTMTLANQSKAEPDLAGIGLDDHYVDPVDPKTGPWLAAFEPVLVHGRPESVQDTGWVVLVQEPVADAVRPARQLGYRLIERGAIALVAILAALTAVWGFVVFVLNESPRFRIGRHLRKRAGLPSPVVGGGTTGTSGSSASVPGDTQPAAAQSDGARPERPT